MADDLGRPWVNNEDGPDCSCGNPTVVKVLEDGSGAVLLCLFHTGEEGTFYRLPSLAPSTWSELSIDQVRQLG